MVDATFQRSKVPMLPCFGTVKASPSGVQVGFRKVDGSRHSDGQLIEIALKDNPTYQRTSRSKLSVYRTSLLEPINKYLCLIAIELHLNHLTPARPDKYREHLETGLCLLNQGDE